LNSVRCPLEKYVRDKHRYGARIQRHSLLLHRRGSGEFVARQLNKWQEKNLNVFKFGAVLRAHVALRSAPMFF